MTDPKSTQIQTDPEVRDRIGEAVMTAMICTHEFDGTVCPTCWESTQRIGEALVGALPQLQIDHDDLRDGRWRTVGEHYRVTVGDRVRAEFVDDQRTVETKFVRLDQSGVAVRFIFPSAHMADRYSILLGSA